MDKYQVPRSEEYDKELVDELERRQTSLRRVSEEYAIDNCSCPRCVCLDRIIYLPASPVGVGTAGGVLLGTSPL